MKDKRFDLQMNNSRIVYFSAFALFLTMPVFYRWNNSFLTLLAYFYVFLVPYYALKKNNAVNKESLIFALCFSLNFFWQQVVSGANYLSTIINTLFPFLLLIPINLRSKSLNLFLNKIFPVFLAISTLSFLLWSFNLVNFPSIIVSSRGSKEYDFISHVFFLVPENIMDFGRFHACFDEPGVIGTLSAIILFFYSESLNKYAIIIYALSGLLSFSIFFYLMIILILINSSPKLSYKIYSFIVFALLLFFVLWIYDKDFISIKLFDRLVFVNGDISGNNRNSLFFLNYFYNTFIHSSDFLFGSSDAFTNSDKAIGDWSVQVFIYRYGFVYVFYSVLIYCIYIWRYKISNRYFFLSIIVFALLTYHRPSFTDLFYYIFFTTVFQSKYLEKNNERRYGIKQCY